MCFLFFYLVIFNNFLTISVIKEIFKVRVAFTIPTDAATILINKIIDTPGLFELKTIKILSI